MGARGPKPYDPTPQEIEVRKRRIRDGWSERTHRLRAGFTADQVDRMDQWTAPLVHLSDLNLDSQDEDYYPYWAN
jgi:hypothetical protein